MKRMTRCVFAIVLLSTPMSAQTASDLYQRAVMAERTTGQLDSAIVLYQRVVLAAGTDRALAARALLAMGRAYETLGRREARAAYERLVRDYSDQRDLATQARARIAALDPPAQPGSTTGAGAMIRQLSRDANDFRRGTVSPSGRYLSYSDGRTNNLGVHDLVTGTNRLVTTDGRTTAPIAYIESSVISPNGLDVAYVWVTYASGRTRLELRVVPVRGGPARVVPLDGVMTREICAWSPDGKSLLVVTGTPSTYDALAFVDVERGTVRRLRNYPVSAALGASVSPDGKWIAFAAPANNELGRAPSIRIIAADGSNEHALVDHPSASWRPLWTPDGRGIVFQSDRAGSVGLWFLETVDDQARGEPVMLMSDVRRQTLLGFSRDGRLFYTPAGQGDISVAALDEQSGEVIGEPKIVATRFAGSSLMPDLSPDGRLLTFISNRGPSNRGPNITIAPGTRVLVIVDLASGDQREFLPLLSIFGYPRWSKDGRWILIQGRGVEGVIGFYRLDAVTGAMNRLTTLRGSGNAAEWSADGRSIFYERLDSASGRRSLWRYGLDDSTHRVVFTADSLVGVRYLSPTPDGEWLGFNARYQTPAGAPDRSAAFALSLRTGELRRLEDGQYGFMTAFRGGDILRTRYRPADGFTEFWLDAPGGGAPRKLAFESRGLTDPIVAGNGNRIAFMVGGIDANAGGIWTIENFLPTPPRGR